MDFCATEWPEWRRSEVSTSGMVDKIVEFCKRYEQLSPEQKSWANAEYAERAIGEYLFQVNKIEKEGFDTFPETQDAIRSKGVFKLALVDSSPQEDLRLEHVCCLYRALRHWWFADGEAKPELCIEELQTSHIKLLGSTNKSIAGHIRSLEKEVVYTNTEDGIHAFVWPTKVRGELSKLFEKTEMLLAGIELIANTKARVESLLKLGGTFFLEFENIHPFLDGNGRCGRILLAFLLRSIMPFPNVFYVDRPGDYGLPPFIAPVYYYDCFHSAQSKQNFDRDERGQTIFTEESTKTELDAPADLTALVIEGVYVGWKRLFQQLESA